MAATSLAAASLSVHGTTRPSDVGHVSRGERRVDLFGDADEDPALSAPANRSVRRPGRLPGLVQPFFFEESDWIAPPAGWAKTSCRARPTTTKSGRASESGTRCNCGWRGGNAEHAIAEDRYGPPILVHPRLGQGAFRVEVLEAYARRCAVTGERTLPVLDAAHIRPYADLGPHRRRERPDPLRKDLHALFDAGYVTVTPSFEFRVSRRSASSSRTAGTTTHSMGENCDCQLCRPCAHPPSSLRGTARSGSADD